MYEQVEKPKENKSRAVVHSVNKDNLREFHVLVDNRQKVTNGMPETEKNSKRIGPDTITQRRKSFRVSSNELGRDTVIQRNLDENLVNITNITKKTDDVYFVSHQGGEVVIKFKGDLGKDTVADGALKFMGHKAPESKLVSVHYLLQKIIGKEAGSAAGIELKKKLEDTGLLDVLVAEKIPGVALGDDATIPTDKTKTFLNEPEFAFDLGNIAAIDLLLGHEDRILAGLNFGNIMDTGNNSGSKLALIDNQIENNRGVIDFVDVMDVIKNKESKYALRTKNMMEGLLDGEGFNLVSFHQGFVLGLGKFLEMKTKLEEYIKEKSGGSIETLKENSDLLTATIDNDEFYKALGSARQNRATMMFDAQTKKKSLQEKQPENKGKKSFFSSLFS